MRHIPLKHYHKLVPGSPPVYGPGNDHLQTVACQEALRCAYTHGSRNEGDMETISFAVPKPIWKAAMSSYGSQPFNAEVMARVDLKIHLSETVASARRHDLLEKAPPKAYPTRGRDQVKLTLPAWLVASIKLIAHGCSVSVGDVAAWALEIGRKE